MKLTKLFKEFFETEKAGGLVLILATVISLSLANSYFQSGYLHFWHFQIGGHSITHWINDGLMTIFFLLIGLELEREIYQGELSDIKNASFPIFGALGGLLFPAAIFLLFNFGTPTQAGAGIPMATDIAFALGILSLLGRKVPASLKVFLTALAVIDDLGAILVIAVFYTQTLLWTNLFIALGIFIVLLIFNRMKIQNLFLYLTGGLIMWYFMYHSGVHATITGILLAFVIPYGKKGKKGGKSPSSVLQHFLHKPVAFFILPVFALANTAITFGDNWISGLGQTNSLGIMAGLLLGKPVGIFLFTYAATRLKLCRLPKELKWKYIIGTGLLAGIGFTMSIFVTLLAYDKVALINVSKMAILFASVIAGILGFLFLHWALKGTARRPYSKESRMSE